MSLATRLTLLCAAASLFAIVPANSFGQEKEAKPAEKSAEPAAAPPKEESSVTDHSIKIAGQSIPYKATVASLFLKNAKDNPEPLISFTHYIRSIQSLDLLFLSTSVCPLPPLFSHSPYLPRPLLPPPHPPPPF